MKIKVDNVEEICAALKEVNGKSKTHTYTVLNLSDFYDKNLKDLPLPKKLWKGAKLYLWSGREMPSSYKGTVIRTHIVLERGASNWFLIHAERVKANRPRNHYIEVTDEQALAIGHTVVKSKSVFWNWM